MPEERAKTSLTERESIRGLASNPSTAAALEYAGLDRFSLGVRPHPDDGAPCLVLTADIQQYSRFLAYLATHFRTADETSALTSQVQAAYDGFGDTQFWFPGL